MWPTQINRCSAQFFLLLVVYTVDQNCGNWYIETVAVTAENNDEQTQNFMIFSGNVELIRNMRKYIYILSGSKHHTYGSCVQISVLFCVCYINSGKSPDKLAASGQRPAKHNQEWGNSFVYSKSVWAFILFLLLFRPSVAVAFFWFFFGNSTSSFRRMNDSNKNKITINNKIHDFLWYTNEMCFFRFLQCAFLSHTDQTSNHALSRAMIYAVW